MDAITHFATLPEDAIDELRVQSKKIRVDYFEPITLDGIRRFMDLEKSICHEVACGTARRSF
jgi:hypothetical protein